MEKKIKKSKIVSVPFDEENYEKIQKAAGATQSIASWIRMAVINHLNGVQGAVQVTGTIPDITISNITASESQAPTPEKKKASDSHVVVARYEETPVKQITYGPPATCPVCQKAQGELGDSALQIVNSSTDKGAWACYECFSSGRWSNDGPAIILKNTKEEALSLKE